MIETEKTAVKPLNSRMANAAGSTNNADTSKTPIVGIITATVIPTRMLNKVKVAEHLLRLFRLYPRQKSLNKAVF